MSLLLYAVWWKISYQRLGSFARISNRFEESLMSCAQMFVASVALVDMAPAVPAQTTPGQAKLLFRRCMISGCLNKPLNV